jgi:hypothetical protein
MIFHSFSMIYPGRCFLIAKPELIAGIFAGISAAIAPLLASFPPGTSFPPLPCQNTHGRAASLIRGDDQRQWQHNDFGIRGIILSALPKDELIKARSRLWGIWGLMKAGPYPSHGDYAWPNQDNGDIAKRFRLRGFSSWQISLSQTNGTSQSIAPNAERLFRSQKRLRPR